MHIQGFMNIHLIMRFFLPEKIKLGTIIENQIDDIDGGVSLQDTFHSFCPNISDIPSSISIGVSK